MFIARRLAKCSSACLRCAGQYRPPLQRCAASSSFFTTAEPHTGHFAGISKTAASAGRSSAPHRDDFRNHVAGAAHDDRVADAHVLAPQLALVVQRGVGHRHAADEHRLQPRHRRQRAGAADLHLDAEHLGGLLLGRVLVREREARRARDEAEALLPVEPVHLVDHAVDRVGQLRRAGRRCSRNTRAARRRLARRRAPCRPGSRASPAGRAPRNAFASRIPRPARRRKTAAAGSR